MGKLVSAMSAKEMQETQEYKEGYAAYMSDLPVTSSTYPIGNSNLLFRIGWGDSKILTRNTSSDLIEIK